VQNDHQLLYNIRRSRKFEHPNIKEHKQMGATPWRLQCKIHRYFAKNKTIVYRTILQTIELDFRLAISMTCAHHAVSDCITTKLKPTDKPHHSHCILPRSGASLPPCSGCLSCCP